MDSPLTKQFTSDSIAYDNPQSVVPSIMYGDGTAGPATKLLDSSSHYKYALATNGELDWTQELKNLNNFNQDPARNIDKPTEDVRNEFVWKEKQRIKEQSVSHEFNRADFFAIGTVYLKIPPTQISITEDKHNFKYKTLRNAADIITTSGRATTRIDLEIYFSGLDDINNKLRPLLAQFKCTPFLPIENDYVRAIIDPESQGLYGELAEAKETLADLKKKNDEMETMGLWRASQLEDIGKLEAETKALHARGVIDDKAFERIHNVIVNWGLGGDVTAVANDELARASLKPSDTPSGQYLDYHAFISKVITSSNNRDIDVASLPTALNEIGILSKKIEDYEVNLNTMFDKNLRERFRNKRIISVLSQCTITTVPGYPETISCRLSMHVFNYDPYVFDFGFVEGYDPAHYTPDINKCDLFVDWYANRFLRENSRSGTLIPYTATNDMSIRYTKNVSYDDLLYNAVPSIVADTILIEDDTFVTGISVVMRNIVQFLPLLSGDRPTCQYMGAYNTSIIVNINSKNLKKVKEIRSMMAVVSRISRTNNKYGRYCMFCIDNPITNFCGLKYFVMDNFSIDTVPGNPGLYSINMEASEIKLGLEQIEQLDRLTLDSNDRVLAAAGYILDRARDFMLGDTQYRQYYDMLWKGSGSRPTPGGDSVLSAISLTFTSPLEGAIRRNLNRVSSTIFPDYYKTPSRVAEVGRIEGASFESLTGPAVLSDGTYVFDSVSDLPQADHNYSYQKTIEQYVAAVYDTMGGHFASYPNGDDMEWDTVREFLVHVWAEEELQSIRGYLLEDTGLVDLKDFVFATESKIKGLPKHLVEPSCYPDLGLPIYNDLGGKGSKFKLTYAELGMLTTVPTMKNKSAQTNWVAMEPDAFYYKMSVNSIMNNFGTNGLDTGIKIFQNIARNNLKSEKFPVEISDWVAGIQRSTNLNADGKAPTMDQINTTVSNTKTALEGSTAEIDHFIDGNTALVKAENGSKLYVRFSGWNPKKYSGLSSNPPTTLASPTYDDAWRSALPRSQPATFQAEDKQNADIANKMFKGATLSLTINNNQSFSEKGKVIVGVTGVIIGDDGRSYSMADIANKSGMAMQPTAKSASDNVVNTENFDQITASDSMHDAASGFVRDALSELSLTKYHSKKIPVVRTNETDDMSASALWRPKTAEPGGPDFDTRKAMTLRTVVKGGSVEETTSVGIRTETPSKEDKTINNRYIYSSSLKLFDNLNYNKNNSLGRFDRFSQEHINGIAERVRGQHKDDTLRMVRAFPTFRFYFIEEDRMEFKPWPILGETRNLDDVYSYNAVMSIDITKSRKEAADVAIVQLLNTRGTLDKERFGLYDKDSMNRNRGPNESADRSTKETADEQDIITEFILKPGTRIKIKMGYCSDPAFLETVFTGMVAEVSLGDVVTIVAQGYGVELLKPITGWGTRLAEQEYSAYKFLNRLIKRTEITHFGFTEWQPIIGLNQRTYDRRLQPKTSSGPYKADEYEYRHPSSWRTWLGVSYLLAHGNDPRNDNIFTPETGVLEDEFHGDGWEFTCENRTVWDTFQEFTRRYPGYVTQVLPYDNRATIYFGPSDGYYSYSSEVRGLYGETLSAMENPDDLMKNAINEGKLKEMTLDQKQDAMIRANAILNRMLNDEDWRQGKEINHYFSPLEYSTEKVTTVLSLAEEYTASQPGQEDDRKLIEDLRKMGDTNGIFFNDLLLKNPQFLNRTSDIFVTTNAVLDSIPMYSTADGGITDRETILRNLWGANLKFPANFKLIRSYHYLDSLKNIISNSIVASEENMWNRVAIISNIKLGVGGSVIYPFGSDPTTMVTAQVDDSIWKENLITKTCNEPNAHTPHTAWSYALGNLCLGVNEMYSGHLTIMGDPTIKPHDVVLINDYYTDMHGAFEVREVNHHFSQDTGFVTTIIPDCICYTNNAMAMASDALAGGANDDYANSLMWVYNFKIPLIGRVTKTEAILTAATLGTSWLAGKFLAGGAGGTAASRMAKVPFRNFPRFGEPSLTRTVSTIVNRPWFIAAENFAAWSAKNTGAIAAVAGAAFRIPVVGPIFTGLSAIEWLTGPDIRNGIQCLQFSLTGWSAGRREPINFLPLFFGGRPYIAGVKGMRRSCWWEPGIEAWQRFVYYHFNLAPRYLSQLMDKAIDDNLSSNFYQMRGVGPNGV